MTVNGRAGMRSGRRSQPFLPKDLVARLDKALT